MEYCHWSFWHFIPFQPLDISPLGPLSAGIIVPPIVAIAAKIPTATMLAPIETDT